MAKRHHPHLGSGRPGSHPALHGLAAAQHKPVKKNRTAALAVLFVDHGVHLVQTADQLTQDAKTRLGILAAALAALIVATDFKSKPAVSAAIASARALIASAYQQISAANIAAVRDLAAIEAGFTVDAVNKTTGEVTLRVPTLTVTPAVEGTALQAWWDAQANAAAAKVAAVIRAGEAAGTAPEVIAALINSPSGPMSQATRHAESLTEGAVQRVAMDARNATLKANGAATSGIEIVATLDSSTCAQCLAYDGATYDMEGNPTGDTALPFNGGPSFHWGCRCSTVPILAGDEPSGGLTARQWLDGKTPDQRAEILGIGRAEMYQKGQITLHDLVSKTGKQLSLGELKKKYD